MLSFPSVLTVRFITHPDNLIEIQGKTAIIRGSRKGNSCLLAVFSGEEQVPVIDDHTENLTLTKKNDKRKDKLSKHLKRLSAQTRARNPRFINVIFPFKTDGEKPTIMINDDVKRDVITCKISYSKDNVNYHDSFKLSSKNISFSR